MTGESSERDNQQIDQQVREEVAIRHVTEELAADYAEAHPKDEVTQVVEEVHERYTEAPVRDFVPSLVERDARGRLEGNE